MVYAYFEKLKAPEKKFFWFEGMRYNNCFENPVKLETKESGTDRITKNSFKKLLAENDKFFLDSKKILKINLAKKDKGAVLDRVTENRISIIL